MKHIVKKGRKIIGYVVHKHDGTFWYVFGKPSQNVVIEFSCDSKEMGISRIEMYSKF
jgi:hypothetical protein